VSHISIYLSAINEHLYNTVFDAYLEILNNHTACKHPGILHKRCINKHRQMPLPNCVNICVLRLHIRRQLRRRSRQPADEAATASLPAERQ